MLLGLYGAAANLGVYSKTPSMTMAAIRTHSVHLSSHPAYPKRAPVVNIDWAVPDPAYKPVDFTHKAVLENDCTIKKGGWADPAVVTEEFRKSLAQRLSNSVEVGGRVVMVDGLPRNPVGRTGMTGRGLLGKYGANFAADPLVTRFDPASGKLQMVAIQRADTKDWAIPGGMVDPGESVSVTLRREFTEEAQNFSGEEQAQVKAKLDELFKSGGDVVYIGYVDDPRNTDIAWMETTCVHFHINDKFLAEHLQLEAGDDAQHVRWLDVSDDEKDFAKLYASHRNMVIQALLKNPVKFGMFMKHIKL